MNPVRDSRVPLVSPVAHHLSARMGQLAWQRCAFIRPANEIAKRLKRAEGHLGTVIGMIEQNSGAGRETQGTPCGLECL